MNDTNHGQTSAAAAPVTLWQTICSVLWAFYGVQSDKNRQRDFANGNGGVFMAVGFGMTALFVLVMIGIVKLIIASAGGA